MRTQAMITNQILPLKEKTKNNLTVEIVKITPEIAENYLKFNIKNRKLKPTLLKFLTNQMEQGFFIENGEAIIFDRNYHLKDGQHRLNAIIKSGKSYHIPVVRGVDPISMATYDTGINRTAGDVLTFNGFKYGTLIASLIASINKYDTKKSKRSDSYSYTRIDRPTNQLILEYCCENYDWLVDIVVNCHNNISPKQKPILLSTAQMGLITYMIGGKRPSVEVYDFIKHITGVLRTLDTATSYLYTKLYNAKINKEPLNFYWILGMAFKAWNYYHDGNPSVKYFKFSVDQDLPKLM